MDQAEIVAAKKNDREDLTLAGKKGRVIIRNLVFDISEVHLRKLCAKFGTILDINIPVNPTNNKMKGFAFVEFANRNDAFNAIKTLNGTKYKGRDIILDSAVGKDRFLKIQDNKEEAKEEIKIQDEDSKVPMEEEEVKPKKQRKQKKIEEELVEEEVTEPTQKKKKSKKIIIEDPVEQEVAEPKQKQKKSKKIVEEEHVEQEEVEQPIRQKRQKKVEDLSQTLFVRNLPLDIDEEQLKEYFEKFGDVTMAKLVINRESGEHKGTGFIKFSDPETARSVIHKSSQLDTLHKQGKFKRNVAMDVDEQELLSGQFDFEGRRIFVFEAMKRDEAQDLVKKEIKAIKPTKDIRKVRKLKQLVPYDPNGKRNLKLAVLGVFNPEEGMNPKEAKRREDHVHAKIQRLKNPNFFVSDTRVALKNLPKSEQLENDLRGLAFQAMQQSNVALKEGDRLLERVWISRDKSILSVSPEEAPTTGLAFLEFRDPENAMTFMKYVIDNREDLLKTLQRRLPIIEFAIEDARKLRKIEFRRENQRQRQQDINQKKMEQNGGKETRTMKKNKVNNVNKVAIENILKHVDFNSESNAKKIQQLWTDIKSRGMKQRMKKKIQGLIEIDLEMPKKADQKQQPAQIQKKIQTYESLEPKKETKWDREYAKQDAKPSETVNKKTMKQTKVSSKVDELYEGKKNEHISDKDKLFLNKHFEGVMNDIKSKVLNKKKQRERAQEVDEVDEIAEKRLEKLNKKAKWFA